jgi:hypothetical protein
MRFRTPAIVLAITACSSPNHANPDAPTAHDASADAQEDAPAQMISGLITLSRIHDTGLDTSDATAQFAYGNIYGTSLGSDGPCQMFQSPVTEGLSAGTITITGTSTPITLTPSGTPAKYHASSLPMPAFSPGATLTVNAAGAEVPAFTATVTAPMELTGFTTPDMISRAAGYHATWTHGTGRVWLVIVGPQAAGDDLLLCKVPDTGSFTVTPSALALFPSAITKVSVEAARVGESDVIQGANELDFVALDVPLGSGNTTLAP